MAPRRLLALLVLACGGLLHAEPPNPPLPPPRPEAQRFEDTPADNNAAFERCMARIKYKQALGKWEQSLTPEQISFYKIKLTGLTAKPGEFPRAEQGYDWEAAASAIGCTDNEVELLNRNKLVFGRKQTKQCFSVYTNNDRPVFITTDSLLNAFHVLFEDCFREYELHRVPLLRDHLESTLTHTRKLVESGLFKPDDLAPGLRFAQLAVGPALRLLGTPPEFFDADLRPEIEGQLAKIRSADDVSLPEWLAPATATFLTIDYRRCKPVGFYADNHTLSNYFRAVRWLQMIPFRSSRDNELTAIALLGSAASNSTFRSETSPNEFLDDFNRFLGACDSPALPDAGRQFSNEFRGSAVKSRMWVDVLSDKKKWLRRPSKTSAFDKISDQRRLTNADEIDPPGSVFHVLSAYRLADGVLFQQLIDQNEAPSGLAVATLLGSEWAQKKFPIKNSAAFVEALNTTREQIDRDATGYEDTVVYSLYLNVLSTLFTPPDPAAPDFMRNEAWSAKSCQTALAGWAQLRHTFTLQSKLAIAAASTRPEPVGFVEPNPKFFDQFARFIRHAKNQFKQCQTFTNSAATFAELLKDRAALVENHKGSFEPIVATDDDDYANLIQRELSDLLPDWVEWMVRYTNLDPASSTDLDKFNRELAVALRAEADRYLRGERKIIAKPSKLEERWELLEDLAYRLSALVQKQLRGSPFDEDEAKFIKRYGDHLAYVMGYFGDPFARDDAPRWVEVLHNPKKNVSLAAAIGRARLLYVLYPWHGTEIFCQGSVMAYYEYDSHERLTDTEWKQLLDSPQAPQQPEWLHPYTAK